MKHYLRTLRERFNRRSAALGLVFLVALGGSGISSLATINDTITATVNGSVTTIDFRFGDGSKALTLQLPTGLAPGDVAWQPITLSNAASNGYVKVPASIRSVTGLQIATDTKYVVFQGVSAASCNASSGLTPNWTTAFSLTTPPWDTEQQIDAGNSLDLCFAYRVGTPGSTYPAGATTWQQVIDFQGYYP